MPKRVRWILKERKRERKKTGGVMGRNETKGRVCVNLFFSIQNVKIEFYPNMELFLSLLFSHLFFGLSASCFLFSALLCAH